LRTIVTYGVALSFPFLFLFASFIIYPLLISFTLLTSETAFYEKMLTDELYLHSLYNTAIFIGLGVPTKMVIAFLLSGFLTHYSRLKLVKILNVLYLLPWAIPAVSAALSFRWTLNYDYGLLNKLLTDIGLPKIRWLLDYETAFAAVIAFHIWKWLPMWTLIFIAGRKAIPEELYEVATIDGASLFKSFTNITAPLLSKLFFISLLLSSIWSLGEFEAVWLVTMAGPSQSTHIITTIGFRYAFIDANLVKGLAAYMSLLPVVLVLLIVLILLTRERKYGQNH